VARANFVANQTYEGSFWSPSRSNERFGKVPEHTAWENNPCAHAQHVGRERGDVCSNRTKNSFPHQEVSDRCYSQGRREEVREWS
jgi:hypothetical protein